MSEETGSTESTDGQEEAAVETPQEAFDISKLHEAGLDDINAEIERLILGEETPEENESEEVEAEAAESDQQVEQSTEEEQAAEETEETQDTSHKQENSSTQPTKEEWEKMMKRLKDQEQYIHRRSQEIGELRKEKRELVAKLRGDLDELDDAKEIFDHKDQISKAEQEIAQLDAEEQQQAYNHYAQTLIAKHLSPDEMDVSVMASVLADDGLPEEVVASFKANPLATVAHPETLVQIGKRAGDRKLLAQAANVLKEKNALIEKLQKQVKEKKPDDVLTSVEKAFKQQPQVNGRSSGAAIKSKSRTAVADPSKMSDAELEAALKSLDS